MTNETPLSQADYILAKFRSLQQLADALTTVRGKKTWPSSFTRWKESGVIPHRRWPEVMAAGELVGVKITRKDLLKHL